MDNRTEHQKNYFVPIQDGAFYKLKKNYEDKDETISFKYIDKKQLTHDTYIMRFEIPDNMILGLELGTHLAIKEKINDEEKATKRKYTPTSWNFEKGYFDLLIKIYHPTSTFPNGGKMTQFLNKLSLNSQVSFLGPLGKCIYYGDGEFKITNKKTKISKVKTYKHICMVAGGTGITPFYQVNFLLTSILLAADKFKDLANFYLIFGNKTENDILLREELDTLSRSQNFQFKLFYTLDHAPENWDQGRGYVCKEMISSVFPKPGDDVLNLLCGPSAMCKKLVIPMLIESGYNQEDIFKF